MFDFNYFYNDEDFRDEMRRDAIDEKVAEDMEERESFFATLIWDETHGFKESRGADDWVACDDDMPRAWDEYLVKGYGTVNGVRKEFLTTMEPEFHVENFEHEPGDEWSPGWIDYDIVAEWEDGWVREAGYSDIHVTHWKQVPDDWDCEDEVM